MYMLSLMSVKKQVSTDSVGQRIRALRLANNLTQDEFAAQLGVSRSAIAQWETDRAGQVRENLERISKVLGTSLAYLVSGETGSLQGDELALMRLYRACAPEDRQILLRTAKRLARS
jgi:transcriptional regulator with XRE-family HTH domain